MARTSASTEAMDRMIRNLQRFMSNQQSLINALRSDYAAVGNEWNDIKYRQLGEVLNQGVRSVSQSSEALNQCIPKLRALKEALEQYLNSQI